MQAKNACLIGWKKRNMKKWLGRKKAHWNWCSAVWCEIQAKKKRYKRIKKFSYFNLLNRFFFSSKCRTENENGKNLEKKSQEKDYVTVFCPSLRRNGRKVVLYFVSTFSILMLNILLGWAFFFGSFSRIKRRRKIVDFKEYFESWKLFFLFLGDSLEIFLPSNIGILKLFTWNGIKICYCVLLLCDYECASIESNELLASDLTWFSWKSTKKAVEKYFRKKLFEVWNNICTYVFRWLALYELLKIFIRHVDDWNLRPLT